MHYSIIIDIISVISRKPCFSHMFLYLMKGTCFCFCLLSVMCQKEWPRTVYESSQTYRWNTTFKVLFNCRHVQLLILTLPLKTSIALPVLWEWINDVLEKLLFFPTAHSVPILLLQAFEFDAACFSQWEGEYHSFLALHQRCFTSWNINSRARVMDVFVSQKGCG